MGRAKNTESADNQTDAQLLERLARADQPQTAADLGTTAKRLKELPTVVVVGSRPTGKAGRPPLLFALAGSEQARQGTMSQVTVANDADDEVKSSGRS